MLEVEDFKKLKVLAELTVLQKLKSTGKTCRTRNFHTQNCGRSVFEFFEMFQLSISDVIAMFD